MTIIRAELQTTVSYFCVDLHYCCLKYAKISTSFPSLGQAIFRNLMLRLLQITFLGVYISKIFREAFPRAPLGCLTPSALVCMTTHTTLASPLMCHQLQLMGFYNQEDQRVCAMKFRTESCLHVNRGRHA